MIFIKRNSLPLNDKIKGYIKSLSIVLFCLLYLKSFSSSSYCYILHTKTKHKIKLTNVKFLVIFLQFLQIVGVEKGITKIENRMFVIMIKI